MNDDEIDIKLCKLGAAPKGYGDDGFGSVTKSDVMAGPKGGFIRRSWEPSTDIAQAFKLMPVVGIVKVCFEAIGYPVRCTITLAEGLTYSAEAEVDENSEARALSLAVLAALIARKEAE